MNRLAGTAIQGALHSPDVHGATPPESTEVPSRIHGGGRYELPSGHIPRGPVPPLPHLPDSTSSAYNMQSAELSVCPPSVLSPGSAAERGLTSRHWAAPQRQDSRLHRTTGLPSSLYSAGSVMQL
ncbi:hypothetical protein NDU88_008468 [Pleurodeles waltl]|uniref:Uncharacterized protein n=1 Tax=Pleurodeles waltl TaxID=8319 RepID=A0AAV7NZB6_PLEWA|nr:hypothetical protein NDU88_008468 [Pleurodeles waltl]